MRVQGKCMCECVVFLDLQFVPCLQVAQAPTRVREQGGRGEGGAWVRGGGEGFHDLLHTLGMREVAVATDSGWCVRGAKWGG